MDISMATATAIMRRAVKDGKFLLRAGVQMEAQGPDGLCSGKYCGFDLHQLGIPQLVVDGCFTQKGGPANPEWIQTRTAMYPAPARKDDLCMDIEAPEFGLDGLEAADGGVACRAKFKGLFENWALALPGTKRGFFGFGPLAGGRMAYNVPDDPKSGLNVAYLDKLFATLQPFLQDIPVDVLYPAYATCFKSPVMWKTAVTDHLRRLKIATLFQPKKIYAFLFPVYYGYQDPVTHQFCPGGESPRDKITTDLFLQQLLTLYACGADGAVIWVDPNWQVKDFPWWKTFRELVA